MRLDQYISPSRILDLQSETVEGAFAELLRVALPRRSPVERAGLQAELLERERQLSTCLGNQVALPHLRLRLRRPYIFVLGRCRKGLTDERLADYENVRLVVLLLAAEGQRDYLNVLASIARLFRERSMVEQILQPCALEEFRERVMLGFGSLLAKPSRQQLKTNRLFLREAERVAKTTRANALLVFADTFAGGAWGGHHPDFRTILVTEHPRERHDGDRFAAVLEVRSPARQRLSQLRPALLVGLSRGSIEAADRLCCLGGVPGSNQFDTLVLVDVEREFSTVLARHTGLLPTGVKVEVLERMLSIATELAVEGREGRPVGCLFVLGDAEKVLTMIKPLVLNPFHGYKRDEKNVLNPFMDETVKELSSIDGAFVIDGDGTLMTAGSLIHAPAEFYRDLPSGLGSRHSAGAAISRAAECIAVVVSASTGQVTLFRHGTMIPMIDKQGTLSA